METSNFKVGDIVVLSPITETKDYIENNPEGKGYQKYVGERGEIISVHPSWGVYGETAEVKFFNINLPEIYAWFLKDLTLEKAYLKPLRKTEVSGEV